MKRIILLYIFIFIFSIVGSRAGGTPDYEKLVKLPAGELLKSGDYYMKRNNPDFAITYFLVLAEKYNPGMSKIDKYMCVSACNSAGLIYYQKANYSKAFNLYLKGVQICERNQIENPLPELYKNIGNVYSSFEDYGCATDYYLKGLQFSRMQKNLDIEIKILNNLTSIYCFMGKVEDAKKTYKEMIRHMDVNKLQPYFYHLYQGHIYENEEKFDSAIVCYKKSAEYAIYANLEPQYKGSSYLKLGKLFEKTRQNGSALHYLCLNTDIADNVSLDMDILSENLKVLVRIYTKCGDHKKALLYKERYWELLDSVFSSDEFNRMKNSQFVYETSKSSQKIESLSLAEQLKEISISKQRKILILISVGLFVFCIMSVLMYFQNKKLRNAYKDLFRRNTEFLKSDQLNKKIRQEYESKLKEERIKKTGQQLGQFEFTSHHNVAINECDFVEMFDERDSKGLYSVNKLTVEQREVLLQKINEVMENTDEFCDCDFGLERLAALIGSNSRYVSQIINDTYNKNFRTYVNEYRIKEAQLRLADNQKYGNYTIKAIAESVGYKSSTNFVPIFKKITGITPSLYQKMAEGAQ